MVRGGRRAYTCPQIDVFHDVVAEKEQEILLRIALTLQTNIHNVTQLIGVGVNILNKVS